jgi:peptide/nickel transport system substrate-binding protein
MERVNLTMRFKKPLACLAVASVAVLAACGGGGSNSGGSSPDDVKSQLENNDAGKGQDPTAVGPLTIDGATKGGTINVIGQSGDMSTEFDPRGVYYSDLISIQTSLFIRTLTQWKYDDDSGNMVLVPDLATDLGKPNDDFTEWTFTLKPGIKYDNGDPIKSADIGYSVASSLDCSVFTDCPSNYLLSTLEGASDYKEGGPLPSGIETPDDQTITFKFTSPFPDLAYYGFFPLFGPIPSDNPSLTKPGNYADHVLSTGPYMIKKRVPQKSLDLVRNPNWDPATDPARAALPDEWLFDTTSTDLKQQDAILMSDRGKTSISYDDIEASDIPTFQSQHADQLAEGPQPLTLWLAPLIDNAGGAKGVEPVPLEARKALAWAYPYQENAKATGYVWNVNRIPTTTLIAPGTPGRQEINGVPDHEAGVTDAQKAHDILEKAGLLGFKLSWLYNTDDPLSVAGMKVVKAAYEAAGFTAAPVATTTTDYSAKRSDPSTPVNIKAGGWFSDWPSGYTWLPPIFAPPNASKKCADQGKWTTTAVVNYGLFCEDDVMAKIKEVEGMPSADQPKAWSDLEKYIQEKYYPVIPLYNGGTVQAHGANVQNVHIDNTGGMPTLKVIWLSQ